MSDTEVTELRKALADAQGQLKLDMDLLIKAREMVVELMLAEAERNQARAEVERLKVRELTERGRGTRLEMELAPARALLAECRQALDPITFGPFGSELASLLNRIDAVLARA